MRRSHSPFIAVIAASSFLSVLAGGEPSPASKPAPPRAAPSGTAAARVPDAGLSPEAALARATAFYESGKYALCSDAFASLLDDSGAASSLSSRAREQASVYRAACLIAQGDISGADVVFRAAIRENPQMAVPSAILFPPAVLERFIVVRTTLLEEIRRAEEERAFREREAAYQARRRADAERARVAELEKLALQETLIVENRRWLASVPFGVGQFQNRQYALGAVFLSTETLLLATAVTATSIELSLHSQAKGGLGFANQTEVDQLNQSIHTANTVSLVSVAALAVTLGCGILQANLAYVPEFDDGVRLRPRKVNPPPLVPLLGPTEGGALVGVLGRF